MIDHIGLAVSDVDAFLWIGDGERVRQGTHVAFRASGRAAVDAFHAAALTAGGRNNGAPGLCPRYGDTYYAAFVFDPDGINVEAVYYAPDDGSSKTPSSPRVTGP